MFLISDRLRGRLIRVYRQIVRASPTQDIMQRSSARLRFLEEACRFRDVYEFYAFVALVETDVTALGGQAAMRVLHRKLKKVYDSKLVAMRWSLRWPSFV